jgi:hypothetical protein
MVAMNPVEDIREMVDKLEQQELQSQMNTGKAGNEVYTELLAGYICLGRVPEAKFLWKRIPADQKQEASELGRIWEVGKSIWTRDNPQVFINLKGDWSAPVKPLIEQICKQYREQALQLVGAAYSTIRISDLSQYLGLEPTAAGQLAEQHSWTWTKQTGIVEPVLLSADPNKRAGLSNQLQRVADFISYLEN